MTDGLPEGWSLANLGDLVEPTETTDPSRWDRQSFIYVDIGSIDNETNTIRSPKLIMSKEAPSRARRVIRTGDVLFSTVRTYLKNIARVTAEFDRQITSTGIAVLRSNGSIDSNFLFYLVITDDFVEGITRQQDGSLYPAVSDRDILRASIPLPPLAEQKRIVAKIDSLLARVKRALVELIRVGELAATLRSSVSASAFHAQGVNDTASRKSKDVTLWALPSDWKWLRFKEVAEIASNLVRPEAIPDLPHIAPDNIESGTGTLFPFKTIAEDGVISAKNRFFPGQIIYSKIRPYLRKAVLVDFDGACSADMYPITPLSNMNREYLFFWLISQEFANFTATKEGRTVLPKINQRELNEMPVPVPPLLVQAQIANRIRNTFARIDKLMQRQGSAVASLAVIEQSILAKAFRGELAAQDPNDEPAGAWLERNSKERAVIMADSRKVDVGSTNGKAAGRRPIDSYLDELPPDGVTFENLMLMLPGTYEDVRSRLFELMSGPNPLITQFFDESEKVMKLRRVA